MSRVLMHLNNMLKRAQVPIIPQNAIRVAVKVDRDLYRNAKNMKIDIHTLWRMTLQSAVDALREEENGKYDRNHAKEEIASYKPLVGDYGAKRDQ